MTFIGMISDHKSFDKVKEELKETQLELIHINKKSIGNIKNIKFEIIIINSNLENLNRTGHWVIIVLFLRIVCWDVWGRIS